MRKFLPSLHVFMLNTLLMQEGRSYASVTEERVVFRASDILFSGHLQTQKHCVNTVIQSRLK